MGEDEGVEVKRGLGDEEAVLTGKALEEISHRAKDCSALVAALSHKLRSKELATANGLSFLEMKNHLMLQYLLGLGGVVLSKVSGKSVKGSSFIDQLVELRVVLDKIRPIDNKLKYQVDKLIRNAGEKKESEDPLGFRANLDNLNEDESDEEDEDAGEKSTSKKDVYCPPKVAAQPYDEEEETPAQQMEKAKKKSINRLLIREMQEEFLETPTEISNRGEGFASDRFSRFEKDKQRYEETYMTRLPETKKDKHIAKSISTMGLLGDEITDFRVKKQVAGSSKKKALKRKKSGGGSTKKRFRKK